MALPKPSPGLLPAENYNRFGQAFNTIDLLAVQLPFAQQAIDALLGASASHGSALTTLQAQGLSASQAITALLDTSASYAQALTELQANDGALDVLVGSLENLTDAQGKAITAEQSRAATAEALARIIAAPKYTAPLDTITLPNGGAVYWNGSTSTGAGETSGGLRVPQGQTGILSQLRTRFQPTAAQRTKFAGRPVQFMVAFRSTVGALTALRDSAGFSTLGGVIEGVQTIAGVKIYSIRPDLWLAVGDAVLTGNESVITIALQVSGNTIPVAADVSFVAIGAMFMPVDATGANDVLADFVQPLAPRTDNLIAAARVRYAPLLGAAPGVTDRVLVIPAGKSGAGSLAIYGAPIAGLQAGTRVRCRFAIQVGGGAFVLNGVSQSDPPVTLIQLAGATIEMTDGSQVGAVAGLTPTSPTTYEASVTFTATGAERIAEFYLKVDENSAVRLAEGQIRVGQMFVEVLSTEPTTTVAAQTARLMESFRAFIAAAPERFRDWTSASSLSDGDYGTIREAVAAMRTGGSQDQPNRVVVLPGTYTNECATGVSINPADHVEIVGKGARRDVEIIARLPDNQAAQDSQQPILLTRSGRLSGLTVRGRNVKYPGHLEAGNAPVAAIWDINDCEFVHEGATGWTETSALGVGQNDGGVLTAKGSTFLSPTSGVGIHNNVGWARGARADFTGCSLIGTGDSATSLAVTSQGAGVMSPANLRGCVLSGHIQHSVSFLPGTPLSAYRGNPFEYTITITDSDPVDWSSPCPFDVLTLTSIPAGNSAVAVGNTGAVRLFGRRPDVRAGAADYAARAYSSHLVSVPADQYDAGVTLAARLGDMRGAAALPLDLFFDGSGTRITITLDQNYSAMSNAQVVADLNAKLSAAMGGNTGGRAFSLSQPYHNRAPIRQPDREATAVNAGTATILKGHVLAKAGRRVRLMTSTDAPSLFAGIALDDAVPGRGVRFLKTGLIGQAHLLFDGDQTFTAGARFQISATNPGRLVAGTDLPVLSVRSVEAYGAALEIIGTVAFTGGSTVQAVRDAFAAVTLADIPGAADEIGGKARSGANSDIESLSGLKTPLSQAQGGTGAGTLTEARKALAIFEVDAQTRFGVGDGRDNDGPALQAMYAYMAANGGTVRIPDRVTIKTPVSLTGNAKPFTVVGSGRETCTVLRGAAIGTMLSFTGCSNIKHEGITFDGGFDAFPTNANHGVSAENCTGMKWRRGAVVNYKNSPILSFNATAVASGLNVYDDFEFDGRGVANNGAFFGDSADSSQRSVRAIGCRGNPGYGIQLKNSTRNCNINEAYAENCTAGFALGQTTQQGAVGAMASDLRLIDNGQGIAGGFASDIMINTAFIDQKGRNSSAIRLGDCARVTGRNIRVKDLAAGAAALRLDNCIDCFFEFTLLDNVPNRPIVFTGTSTRNTVIIYGAINSAITDWINDTSQFPGTNRVIFRPGLDVVLSDLVVLKALTVETATAILTTDGGAATAANSLVVSANKAMSIEGVIIARATNNLTVKYTISATVRRGSSASAIQLVGTPSIARLHADQSTGDWVTPTLTLDTTLGSAVITVGNTPTRTVNWEARLRVSQL